MLVWRSASQVLMLQSTGHRSVAGEAPRGIAKKGCNVGLSAYPQHNRTAPAAVTRNLPNTPVRPKRVS
jgi:hypothetical protein